jgi:hypothetical protein
VKKKNPKPSMVKQAFNVAWRIGGEARCGSGDEGCKKQAAKNELWG